MIIELSNRMLNLPNYNPVTARLGGDDFALSFQGRYSHEDLKKAAEQIIESCNAPILVNQNVLNITISVGISVFPVDASDRISLIKNADIAMYRAKSEGYNKYVFYDPFFIESLGKKAEIEMLLRNANIEKDFELFYQPQFNLTDNKLIGAEALLRWKSTEHGYIPPNEFIPIAEEINYISKIGKWVMAEAINQIIKWNTAYFMDMKMGINISPKQLSEESFSRTLKSLIHDANLNTEWLDAEITENVMLEKGEKVNAIFNMFNDLSISVSIDDFGSGFSSWGYLTKYHFDRIKIDKTLIDDLSSDNSSGVQVVKAIIAMANAMGIKTIAEGVETQEQLNILKEINCHQIQGFLLGRPVSASIFEEIFIKNVIL